jgi:hypothetical protein
MVYGCTHVLRFGDGGEIDLNLGHGEDIGRRGHVDKEVCNTRELVIVRRNLIHFHISIHERTLHCRLRSHSGDGAKGANHEVLEQPILLLVAPTLVRCKTRYLGRFAASHAFERAVKGA